MLPRYPDDLLERCTLPICLGQEIVRRRQGGKSTVEPHLSLVEVGVLEGLVGDGVRLGQVLTNLVQNAIKFTETGAVRLEITAAEAGGACRLAFTVRDTGPGIAPENVDRLFTPFERLGRGTLLRRYRRLRRR